MENSIIVPVYQDYHILNLFCCSLRDTICDYQSTEIIFVNDGSGSKIQEYLESFARDMPERISICLIHHEEPRGCAVSINEALERACGQYIFLLDSDLILPHDWLAKMTKALNHRQNVGIVGSVLLYPQTGGIQHCGIMFTEDMGRHLLLNALPSTLPVDLFSVQLVVFAMCGMKRSVVEKVGLLDEDFFNGYEDFDYQMRAKQNGFDIVIDPCVISYHWERSSGIHRNFNRKANIARFWRKWGKYIQNDFCNHVSANLKRYAQIDPQLQSEPFIGIDLAEVRHDAVSFWKYARQIEAINLIAIYDYSTCIDVSQALWLPQILGETMMKCEHRLLYLVDNFVSLRENRYWIENRRSSDVIMDLYGNIIELKDLYQSCWPGTKIR